MAGQATMATMARHPRSSMETFPFMKLPIELRVMVYERIPRKIKQSQMSSPVDARNHLILLQPTTTTSILAVFKEVRNEAESIVRRTLNKFILEKRPKTISTDCPDTFKMLQIVLTLSIKQFLAAKNGAIMVPRMFYDSFKRIWHVFIIYYAPTNFRADKTKILRFANLAARQLLYRYHEFVAHTGGQPRRLWPLPADPFFEFVFVCTYASHFITSADKIRNYFYMSRPNSPLDSLLEKEAAGTQNIVGLVLSGQFKATKDSTTSKDLPYESLGHPVFMMSRSNYLWPRVDNFDVSRFLYPLSRERWEAEWPQTLELSEGKAKESVKGKWSNLYDVFQDVVDWFRGD